MTSVEINIDKIKTAITAAEELAATIDTQRANVTFNTPISLPTLWDTGVGTKSQWIEDNLDELTSRRDLAILLDTKDDGHVTYTIAVDNLSSTKDLLGETLAENGLEIQPAFVDDFNAYAALMANWVDDPDVMSSMYTALGPRGTLTLLSNLAQDDAGYGLDPQDQQDLLDQIRDGLETATTDPTFPDVTFAKQLVEEAGTDPNDLYQQPAPIGYNPSGALTFLLTDSTFDRPFLDTLASELDDFERVEMNGSSGLWGNRPNNGADFSKFLDQYGGSFNVDPMVGLMSAFENNPEASLDFFSNNDDPDEPGEGVNSRAYYYIHQRNWNADGYDSITGAIDAATTDPSLISDPESADAQNAARLASKFVDYLSTRGNFDNILQMTQFNGASENVAHIMTTYMAGVDHALTPGANSDVDPGVFEYTSDAHQGVIPNMPLFDRESLEKISLLAMNTDDGFAQMRTGLNEYRADTLSGLADQLAANPDASTLQTGLTTGLGADARLEGFFVNTIQNEQISDADERDARTAAWIEFGSDALDVVPIPGVDDIAEDLTKNIVNGAIDRGKGAGKDAITDWLQGEGKEARASANQAADATLEQHSYMVATLLADRGLAADPDLEVPPWDEYSQMSDSEQASIRSELFSVMTGVGGYFNIDDYNQAYSDEFEVYFE